jgi:methionyl-tRNA formyltransferase
MVVIGGVGSTRRTLEALIRHRANVVGVFGLRADRAHTTTDHQPLGDLVATTGAPLVEFTNVNDRQIVAAMAQCEPDIIWAVGLSQLVGPELRALAKRGVIGFHPTRLPVGRGRAPIAWLALGVAPGAATFFEIADGPADSGPLLEQEPFEVDAADAPMTIVKKAEEAMTRALDRLIPRLNRGEWGTVPQDESAATHHGARRPEDGRIEWTAGAEELERLIRASGPPHPGAYTYLNGRKVLAHHATVARQARWTGVVGRVLATLDDGSALVMTGDGVLALHRWQWADDLSSNNPPLRPGVRLGMVAEDEIANLRKRVSDLEARVAALESGAAHRSSQEDR